MKKKIDKIEILRAFIEYKSLSYTDIQDKEIVPPLDKQERRTAFRNVIDRLIAHHCIELIPGSDPVTWVVSMDNAILEYYRMTIEEKEVIEKYSFEKLGQTVKVHHLKLKYIYLFRVMAVVAFVVSLTHFITGMNLAQLIAAIRQGFHSLLH